MMSAILLFIIVPLLVIALIIVNIVKNKKNMKKEILIALLVTVGSFAVFSLIFLILARDDIKLRFSSFDPDNLSSTYLIGFYYETGDFLENAPSVLCRVRKDGTMEADYRYKLSNGERITQKRFYEYSSNQFDNINLKIDLRRLYNLNPKCLDPKDVCDGGSIDLMIYDRNDEILKTCGGFCPTNDEFLDMSRVLNDNLPEEFIRDAAEYKRVWLFNEELTYAPDYGVFLSYEGPLENLKEYEISVIDAQYYSAEEINDFTDYSHYVLSYINIGSLENFRDYYDEYRDLALGEYEHWDEEVWMDVSDERWQRFILEELAPELAAKGIDGFFVDNCDVYYYYPSAEMLEGLSVIMEGLKNMGLQVIINGGDTFLDAYTDSGRKSTDVVTGINQESVYTCINWEKENFGLNTDEEREYFESYLDKYAREGIYIFTLEYSDGSQDIPIENYNREKDYIYYISHSLELNYPQ